MSNFNPTFNQNIGVTGKSTFNPNSVTGIIARVTHVVQGPYLAGTDIRDQYYNDPTDLGTITFQVLSGVQDRTQDSSGNLPAKPFFSALKQYPVEGEIVNIILGPSTNLNVSRGQTAYFYLPPYNLWNSNHQNAFPDLGDYAEFVNDIHRNYQDSSTLNQPINTSATGSLNFPLGPDFVEQSNIKSLKQFTGDTTLEGRWGNSIRFGSTAANNAEVNYWSSTGTPGNPITIIRNGQGRQSDNIAWIPTIENINRDPSSIYLTNGQKIVIDDIDNNFSLASLGVDIANTVSVSISIQQQLTSIDTLSATEQDNRINNLS